MYECESGSSASSLRWDYIEDTLIAEDKPSHDNMCHLSQQRCDNIALEGQC